MAYKLAPQLTQGKFLELEALYVAGNSYVSQVGLAWLALLSEDKHDTSRPDVLWLCLDIV